MRFLLPLFWTAIAAAQGTYTAAVLAGSDWVGDNGPATQALLFQAEGLATDLSGNIYVADALDHRVRQVSAAGVIRTVAGTGQPGFSGDGGPATAAQLNAPYGLAFDSHNGNLYIADLGNGRVRRVSPDGIITTIAATPLIAPRNLAIDTAGNLYISDFYGHGVYRLGADGVLVPLIASPLVYPTALAVDRSGVLYVADSGNHLIRKFDRGVLSPVAAAATPTGLALDTSGALYIADSSAGQIIKIPPGTETVTTIQATARDMAFGPDGSLYASAGSVVRKILPSSRVIAGGGNTAFGDYGAARDARLNHPSGVTADAFGNVYIADRDNHRIRHITPDGIITTIAGTGTPGNAGDGGLATLAQLNGPSSVSLDAAGDLIVADTGNHRVRKFTPGGIMLPVAATVTPVNAVGDAAGNTYISDSGAKRIYLAAATGVVYPLIDGSQSPHGMAVDGDGNLYLTDSAAGRVWRRARSGATTELGAGRWISPRGIALSNTGELFVADSGLGQILRIDPSGLVAPLAVDTAIGTSWDVAVGPSGTLYVADPDHNRLIVLTPAATVDAVNAASLVPGPLAPGMLVEIRGADPQASEILFAGYPATILAMDDARILVQAPAQISGQIQIEVRGPGMTPVSIAASVADAAPGLFTTGSSQAAALNADGTLNSTGHPAARGSWISFYGTGQGIRSLPVSVRIGSYLAEVLYSGEVAGYPGLFQINVRVPDALPTSGILPATVTVGTATSQSGVTIVVE